MKLRSIVHPILAACCLVTFLISSLSAQAKVYLVIGSDTAIWDGMDTNVFHCTYALSLFTDPGRNAYKVMDPAYRSGLVDSYGQTIKFTWWMMGGDIFRYATNKNVPLPNTMTPYLMHKYHGAAVAKFGDEISMHYHTFVWTDYDKDGIYWWNQAKSFTESADDFDVTLSQYLLEENVYPVSFRSGWHAMDNIWQQTLDTLLPFCMHDDYPNVGRDTIEPLDNIYDWSKSSSEFVPFHPSADNYQLAGSLKGYNLRSEYMASLDSLSMLGIFAKANAGTDQVVCLWAHLPEDDFTTNATRINRLAHAAAAKYPAVKFRYCTAVEGMQRWLKTTDATAPTVTLTEKRSGDNVKYVVTSNEPLFQPAPFLATKDVNEKYTHLRMQQTGTREWTTIDALPAGSIAKVGVAAIDTVGNLTTTFLRYVPDDIFIDNQDSAYAEVAGTWANASKSAWGTDARAATIGTNDSAKVQWKPVIPQTGKYNLFAQIPSLSNPATVVNFRALNKGQVILSTTTTKALTTGDWVYLGTVQLDAGSSATIEMAARSSDGQAGKVLAADVLKISALVRDRQIVVNASSINFGDVSELDTAKVTFQIENHGTQPLTITSIRAMKSSVSAVNAFPLTLDPMQPALVTLRLPAATQGGISDTLLISSNDPLQPVISIPLTANVIGYFQIADNDDAAHYKEFGPWSTSNAQAYGASSRYSALPTSAGTYVDFSMVLKKSGVYDIQIIVPTTVNASSRAKYVLRIGNTAADSAFVNQNTNSGSWVTILNHSLPALTPIDVIVTDASTSPSGGTVLRADALRCSLKQATSVEQLNNGSLPTSYILQQNHPNPFNPSTRIEYAIPTSGHVSLCVYDMLGREVAVVVDAYLQGGWYSAKFDARTLASGVYLYRMECNGFAQTMKLVVLK
ncbi:MAG TPA: T9SS type A sorting domain-containing protein [Bacteroidota bacterium]|nr:T9SS type A sorting domain-containing protein [Bacteroidota bacterium]